MVIRIHSDASYLSVNKARSRRIRYFYLFDPEPLHNFTSYSPNNSPAPPVHGAVHVSFKFLKNLLASAIQVEIAAIFVRDER